MRVEQHMLSRRRGTNEPPFDLTTCPTGSSETQSRTRIASTRPSRALGVTRAVRAPAAELSLLLWVRGALPGAGDSLPQGGKVGGSVPRQPGARPRNSPTSARSSCPALSPRFRTTAVRRASPMPPEASKVSAASMLAARPARTTFRARSRRSTASCGHTRPSRGCPA